MRKCDVYNNLIDNIEAESSFETSFALVEYYQKQLDMDLYLEYSINENDGEIYQEGLKEAWESDTSAIHGREDESMIMRILKFIPRLLRNFIKWIWSKLKQFWAWLTGKKKKDNNEKEAPINPPEQYSTLSDDMKDSILAEIRNGIYDSLFDINFNNEKLYPNVYNLDDNGDMKEYDRNGLGIEVGSSNYPSTSTKTMKNPYYQKPRGTQENMRRRGKDGVLHNTREQIHKSDAKSQISATENTMPKNPGAAPSLDVKERKDIAIGILSGEFHNVRVANNAFMKILAETMKHLDDYTKKICVKATESTNTDRNINQFLSFTNTYASQLNADNKRLRDGLRNTPSTRLTLNAFYERINKVRDYLKRCGDYLTQMINAFEDTTTFAGKMYALFNKKDAGQRRALDESERISDAKKAGRRVKYNKTIEMYDDEGNVSNVKVKNANVNTLRGKVAENDTVRKWVRSFNDACTSLKNTLKISMGAVENVCVANRAVTSALRKLNKLSTDKRRAALDSGKYDDLVHEAGSNRVRESHEVN